LVPKAGLNVLGQRNQTPDHTAHIYGLTVHKVTLRNDIQSRM